MSKGCHIVFLEQLHCHAIREVCLGAAEEAGNRADWLFDPWPFLEDFRQDPSLRDLKLADGIITSEKINRRFFAKHDAGIPRVLFQNDMASDDVPSVGLDEVAIGTMAAEHLHFRGYRSLAFIGSSDWRWSKGRELGFSAAARRLGLTAIVHEFPIDQVPVFWDWHVSRRNESLVRVLESLPRPCGIFGVNDVIACFVIHTARMKGYRVPEDFGVLGCDDDPVPVGAAGLTLSSIHPDFYEVGRRSVQLLADILSGERVKRRTLVTPARVVVRASTDIFLTGNPLVRRAQKHIEEHRHERLYVRDLTNTLGTNRMTLNRHFQRHLNTGIQAYILKRRLDYACDQLREGRLSVKEIANACRFSSGSYFSHVFKKIIHDYPRRFRQQR